MLDGSSHFATGDIVHSDVVVNYGKSGPREWYTPVEAIGEDVIDHMFMK